MSLRAHALRAAALVVLGLAPAAAHAGELREFCAERPGSATPACILDAGHLMLEVDALDIERDRNGPESETTTVALSPHIRLGLTERLEAQVTFSPIVRQRLRDRDAGMRETTTGFGDTQLALKFGLKNPDGSGLAIAALPFVSLPTAQRGLGAHGVEGGVVLPVTLDLPGGFDLGFSPEADVLRNDAGGGTHGRYFAALGVGHDLGGGVAGSVELIGAVDDAPEHRRKSAALGAALAWIPHGFENLQLDAGGEVALNHDTPDSRVYVGVSRRF